jgi:hypothetical protein
VRHEFSEGLVCAVLFGEVVVGFEGVVVPGFAGDHCDGDAEEEWENESG